MVTLIPMEEQHIRQCAEIDTYRLIKDEDDLPDDKNACINSLIRIRIDGVANYFRGFIGHKDRFAYCILENNQLVGYITAVEMPDKSCGTTIYIDEIRIAWDEQQKGYGTAALEQFFSLFNSKQMFSLITEKELPAYHVYQKLKFYDYGDVRYMTRSSISEIMQKMETIAEEE